MNEKKFVSIEWSPNKNLEIPIYKQIIDYMREKISNGDWSIGSFLPTQRELAKIFKVNRSTIIYSLKELEADGLIQGKSGDGTKIISNIWPYLLSSSTLNWHNYSKIGTFKENLSTIQTINKVEFKKEIIRMSTGELSPKLYPTKMMKDIFSRLSDSSVNLNYIEPLGLLELRETLCERIKIKGIECTPSNILITSGSLQALQLISLCLVKVGAHIYSESPSYLNSLQLFQSNGADIINIELDKEGIKYWNITPREKENEESILYTIPNFSNPTGILMTEKRRKQLFEFCSNMKMPIIEDDAYGELWIDEPPPRSLKSYDSKGLVIYLGTLSKTLAPGLRVGWIVAPEAVISRLSDVKMQIDYGVSSVSQWILKDLLSSTDYDNYLQEIRVQLKIRRNLMLKSLEKYFTDIASWNIPEGGFYIWVILKKQISSKKIFQALLDENILVNTGDIYGFNKKTAIRLSYSYLDIEDIEINIKRISEIIIKISIN